MKIAMIAPFAPYRGGIARHSGAIARALMQRTDIDLECVSFSMLYPDWLYPGESTCEPDAPPSSVPQRVHSLNPYNWRQIGQDLADRCDLLIVPAWTFFAAPCLGSIARIMRSRGRDVVMMVHNAADHETSAWKSGLLRWQLKAASRFVTHTAELANQLAQSGLNAPVAVEPHPPFDDFPLPTGALPRRSGLELLCFGIVRPYKGIDIALRALALSGRKDIKLTIAGEIWEDRAVIEHLANDTALAGQIELRDKYITEQDAAELFARSDAVVLPYRSVTGSGVLAMATHYRKPVIASNLPALQREIDEYACGWTFDAGDDEALADILRKKVTRTAVDHVGQTANWPAAREGWDNLATKLAPLSPKP